MRIPEPIPRVPPKEVDDGRAVPTRIVGDLHPVPPARVITMDAFGEWQEEVHSPPASPSQWRGIEPHLVMGTGDQLLQTQALLKKDAIAPKAPPRQSWARRDAAYVRALQADLVAAKSGAGAGDPALEYPNFFDGMPEAKERLRLGVQNVLSRIQIPMQRGASNSVVLKDGNTRMFYPLFEGPAILDALAPNTRVLAAGGMVRAAIGLLYERMYQGVLEGRSPEETLDSLIFEELTPLTDLDARGMGSDIDLYVVDGGSGYGSLRKAFETVVSGVHDKLKHDLSSSSAIKSTILPWADLHTYDEGVGAAVSQGGSALDWLAFDVLRGEFVEPAEHPGIIDKLLGGEFDYEPEAQGYDGFRDPPKQTVRGLRALFELPFLKPSTPLLQQEVVALLKMLEGGEPLTHRVFDQLDKLVRNARAGAMGRMEAPAPGSLDEQLRRLADALGPRYFPRLLPRLPLGPLRTGDSLPPEVLKHLGAGHMFTTAVGVDQLPLVVRSGPTVTEDHPSFGRAVGLNLDGAPTALKAGEVRLPLRLREAPPARVLDAEAWRARGGALSPDVVAELTREQGVDAIWDGQKLWLTNADAAVVPSSRYAFASILGTRLEAPRDGVPVEHVSYDLGRRVVQRFGSAWDAAAAELFPIHALAKHAGEPLDGPSPQDYLEAAVRNPGFRASQLDRLRLARMYEAASDLQTPEQQRRAHDFMKALLLSGGAVEMNGFRSLEALMRRHGFTPVEQLEVLLHGRAQPPSTAYLAPARDLRPWSSAAELLTWKSSLAPALSAAVTSTDATERASAVAVQATVRQALSDFAERLAARVPLNLAEMEAYAALRALQGGDAQGLPELRPLALQASAELSLPGALRTYGALYRGLSAAERQGLPVPRDLALQRLRPSMLSAPMLQKSTEGWTGEERQLAEMVFRDEPGAAGVARACGLTARDMLELFCNPKVSDMVAASAVGEPILRWAEEDPAFRAALEAEVPLRSQESVGPRSSFWQRGLSGLYDLNLYRRPRTPDVARPPQVWGLEVARRHPDFEAEAMVRLKAPQAWLAQTAEGFTWRDGRWVSLPDAA